MYLFFQGINKATRFIESVDIEEALYEEMLETNKVIS